MSFLLASGICLYYSYLLIIATTQKPKTNPVTPITLSDTTPVLLLIIASS